MDASLSVCSYPPSQISAQELITTKAQITEQGFEKRREDF